MGPKTAKVYETLRERLTAGEYAAGDKLPSERALVEELGIGRTALRQVLARLVTEGALEVRGRSSYRVPGAVSVGRPEGGNRGGSTVSAISTTTVGSSSSFGMWSLPAWSHSSTTSSSCTTSP